MKGGKTQFRREENNISLKVGKPAMNLKLLLFFYSYIPRQSCVVCLRGGFLLPLCAVPVCLTPSSSSFLFVSCLSRRAGAGDGRGMDAPNTTPFLRSIGDAQSDPRRHLFPKRGRICLILFQDVDDAASGCQRISFSTSVKIGREKDWNPEKKIPRIQRQSKELTPSCVKRKLMKNRWQQ